MRQDVVERRSAGLVESTMIRTASRNALPKCEPRDMMWPWMSEISTRSGPNRRLWNTHVHDANEAISTRSVGSDGRRKTRLPPRADERDRALYAKLRDYLIRVDDDVTCKTC